ncbi:MAG: hypothetical protein JWO19_4788 [Bryobacterales bacterium]|nr:hypothetical protein [Bryobacterales bacterium]
MSELIAELALLPKLALQRELLDQLRDRLLDVSGSNRIDPIQRIHAEPRTNRRLLTKLRALLCQLLRKLSVLGQVSKLRLLLELNLSRGNRIDVLTAHKPGYAASHQPAIGIAGAAE